MAGIQIHTADGWVDLDDIIQGEEKCSICGVVEPAEGAGFAKCNPPELMIYLCREHRKTHHD